MAQSVIGGPYTAPDETTVYANSGMGNFDGNMSAFYDMLAFTDPRAIRWSMSFSADWDKVEAQNIAIGVVANVGGVEIIRHVVDTDAASHSVGAQGAWPFVFFVPAKMAVDINLINPDGSAMPDCQGNISMVGTVIKPLVKGDASVGPDGALGGSSTYVPKDAPPPTRSYPDADKFPDMPSIPISEEWTD